MMSYVIYSFEVKKSGDQFPRKVTTCSRHYKPKLILPLKSVLLYHIPFTLKIHQRALSMVKNASNQETTQNSIQTRLGFFHLWSISDNFYWNFFSFDKVFLDGRGCEAVMEWLADMKVEIVKFMIPLCSTAYVLLLAQCWE